MAKLTNVVNEKIKQADPNDMEKITRFFDLMRDAIKEELKKSTNESSKLRRHYSIKQAFGLL